MDENETNSPFVVITGDPQQGKGERISRVRSHITKRRHQQDSRQQARNLQPFTCLVPYSVVHPTPSGLSLAHISHQRMQSFLHKYLHYSRDVHPSFRIVVLAAATCAPLMSAKILTASTWDDLNNTGEISNLTRDQGVITRRLINGSLGSVHEACSDANIAALASVLVFDLINEDRIAFCQHKRIIHELIRMRGGMQVLGFEGHLAKSMPLIEQWQRVIKITMPADYSVQSDGIFSTICQPLDLRIFTFGRDNDTSPESTTSFSAILLGHLSQLLLLPRGCASQLPPAESQRCLLSQYTTIYRDLVAIKPFVANNIDIRAEAILHAALLFSWSGFASYKTDSTDWSDKLIALRASLQHPDLDRSWAHLPGALTWCLAIGARLARGGSIRKWFMMQLVRVTSCIALDQCEEVLQSLRLVVQGMDAAEILAG